MNRREALRGLSLSIGYVVAVPTVLNTLQSCTTETPTWKSKFLNENEKVMVSHLVDIILPASEIPGGLDLNLPEFIDLMCKDVLSEADQDFYHQGSKLFAARFEKSFGHVADKADRKEIETLFSSYFDKPQEDSQRIIKDQGKGIDEIDPSEKDDYLIYKFLFQTRTFSLLGYYTSEKIGKEVLNFDPIPGVWEPCIPEEDIGNAWAI